MLKGPCYSIQELIASEETAAQVEEYKDQSSSNFTSAYIIKLVHACAATAMEKHLAQKKSIVGIYSHSQDNNEICI